MSEYNCTTHHHACDCREAKFAALERENAALRDALVQCEDALRHALIMSPLDPFQRGKVITAALDKARAAIDAARKEQP